MFYLADAWQHQILVKTNIAGAEIQLVEHCIVKYRPPLYKKIRDSALSFPNSFPYVKYQVTDRLKHVPEIPICFSDDTSTHTILTADAFGTDEH